MDFLTDAKQLGEFMRNVRRSHGWSLAQAEEKTGIKTVVIGSYERADRNPNVPALIRWVEAFGHRLAVLGPEDVVVRSVGGRSSVDWFVLFGGDFLSRIPCASRQEAEDIWEHMPGSRIAFRTHIHGDLQLAGEEE